MAARAMCLTIQDAGRKASPLELSSTSVKPPDTNNGISTAGADTSPDSKPPAPDNKSGGVGGGSRSSSPCRALASSVAPAAVSASALEADSKHGAGADTAGTSSRSGSSRTRTRTNVSLPTGTLAAERGTWKMQPWRLWPVHQSAAAALVDPCLKSVVAIPEVVLLRKALAALADRTDNALRIVDSGSESSGAKRGRDRDAGDGDGGTSGGAGGGSGARARPRGSGSSSGGAGGRARVAAGAPAVQAGGSLKGSGGGVLVGAAPKRRRSDDS